MRDAMMPSSAYSETGAIRRACLTERGTIFFKVFRVIMLAPFLAFPCKPMLFHEKLQLNWLDEDFYSPDLTATTSIASPILRKSMHLAAQWQAILRRRLLIADPAVDFRPFRRLSQI